MQADSGNGHKVTFEDAWQLWEEVEGATGATVVVTLHRPRTLQGGRPYPARLAATATRREGKVDKQRTAYVQIGGTGGARTVPAALVRALTELTARLEESEADAVRQASF